MEVPYTGKSEYCYANGLHMVLSAHPVRGWSVPAPGRIECLTTLPFGALFLDRARAPLFLFSPATASPDSGVDLALDALGWTSKTFVGSTTTRPAEAWRRLTEAVRTGPALVGPVDLGELTHNPRARYLRGGDHYVVAYRADRHGVTFHDPFGFPHAWLPPAPFLRAWKRGGVGYRRGPFTLRSHFRPEHPAPPREAVARTVPRARAAMGEDPGGPVLFGSLGAFERLREAVRSGLSASLRETLVYFSLPLGARRRLDAARFAADARLPRLARLFNEQSCLIGHAQYAAVHRRDPALRAAVEEIAELEAQALRSFGAAA